VELLDAIEALNEAAADGRFIAYGPRPIPHELDLLPQALIDAYLVADASEFVECLSRESVDVLRAFGERQATSAVRHASAVELEHALVALGLAFCGSPDSREDLLVMPLPWHAAKHLGLDPATVFKQTAKLLAGKARDFLLTFCGRAPQDQTLECMGYVVGADADGFRYVRTW
jgi:hypothetical protein